MPATTKGAFTIQEVRDQTLDGAWSYCDPPPPLSGGDLYITGNNGSGSGLNDTIHRSSPVQIPGKWTSAIGNLQNYIGIKTDGTMWAWGRNDDGWLGTGDLATRSSPHQIPGTTWCKVFYNGGSTSHAAIKNDSTLWAWSGTGGNNSVAQLSSPVQIPGTTWCHIAIGGPIRQAFKTDNTMYVWGNSGNYGYLGLGQRLGNLSSPVQLPGAWCTGSIGGQHSTAIKTDGTLWVWGQNSDVGTFGLNVGGYTYRSSPVQIPGTTWCKVTSSGPRNHAIKTDNTLWGWGENGSGKLGIGTAANVSSPTQIPGAWNDVTSASYGAMAKKTDGTLWVWGVNTGQYTLGTNDGISYSSPVQIPGTWRCGIFGYSNSAYIRCT